MKTHNFRALLTRALLAASAGTVFALSPAALAAPTPKISNSVITVLTAAQADVTKKDYASALIQIHKAQALGGLTDFDKYKINQFLTFVAANLGDDATADTAAEAAADSPAMPDSDKVGVTRNALVLALTAKHADKAAQYAKTLQDAGVTDAQSITAITQAYYMAGNYAQAQAMAQKRIDATPPGQFPDYNALELLLSAQVQQKDEAGAEKTLEMLVVDYNKPSDWQRMIDIAFGSKGLRDVDELYLGRLLFATGAPVSKADADLIASTASHLTFYGDTVLATTQGATPIPGVDAKAAADQKSMADQIAAGAKQGGQYNVKLAEALYGYGRYADAEAAARAAIAKGGAADPSEPPMVLAMALVSEGKYSDAVTAFDQVTGGGPATPRIVRLWKGFAQSKATPAPAASAAPAPAQ